MSKLLGLLAINNSAARSNGLMLVARNCRQSYLVRSLVTSSSKVETKNKPLVLGLWKRFLASHKPVEQSPSKSSNQAESEWERSTRYKIFYGFNYKNEASDKALAHFYTYIALLGFLFIPFFFIYYYPDYRTNDWCYREAYLELARREAAGEPLVSPDYVPSDRIKLPSDEELGDTEIVI